MGESDESMEETQQNRSDVDGRGANGADSTTTRRGVLRTTAATATAATGLGVASGSAQAGALNCTTWPDAPAGYPEIDLESGQASADINAAGETTIYVHGWNSLKKSGDQAYTLEQGLDAEYGYWWQEYPGQVVAATWDSDTLDFGGAWRYAGEIGHRLAGFIADHWDRDTRLNVVGHSLGARAALNMLNGLHGRGVSIDDVVVVGAAAHDDSVCNGGDYADGIRYGANRVTSLHSGDDFAVCSAYELWPEWLLQSALGCSGPSCGWFGSTPENFVAKDVSSYVDNHCGYFTEDGSGADHEILSGLGH